MRTVFVLGCAALFASGAALADNKNASAGSVPDGDKIVCRTESTAGSLIPRRFCMKKSDWAQGGINARAARDAQYMSQEPDSWRAPGRPPISPYFRGTGMASPTAGPAPQ